MKELVPDIDTEFHNYLARHNKDYAGNKAEYERRKLNFQANLFMVRRHNKFEYSKTAGYRLDVNFMSDWDADENSGWFYGSLGREDRGIQRQIEQSGTVDQPRRRQLLGAGKSASSSSTPQEAPLKKFNTENMLPSIDWRETKGAVSSPKI
jgi:hypothetical protein